MYCVEGPVYPTPVASRINGFLMDLAGSLNIKQDLPSGRPRMKGSHRGDTGVGPVGLVVLMALGQPSGHSHGPTIDGEMVVGGTTVQGRGVIRRATDRMGWERYHTIREMIGSNLARLGRRQSIVSET